MINLILTSSPFTEDREFNDVNGFKNTLKKFWGEEPNVLYIASFPNEYEITDEYYNAFKNAFLNAGFKFGSINLLDYRNIKDFDSLFSLANVIMLPGGHTPTEIEFFNELNLKDKLKKFDGLLIGSSAGSMNMANVVYCPPELEGEAIDPNFKKYFPGLGLTNINILPHHSEYKDAIVDGKNVYKEIVIKDSLEHEFFSYSDGTYIVVSNGKSTLYGEAFLIKDEVVTKISNNNDIVSIHGVIK